MRNWSPTVIAMCAVALPATASRLTAGTVPMELEASVYESARHAVVDFYRSKRRRREAPIGMMEDLEAIMFEGEHSEFSDR